jgi:hypothetical protein
MAKSLLILLRIWRAVRGKDEQVTGNNHLSIGWSTSGSVLYTKIMVQKDTEVG